jgi:hypothetical protein
MTATTPDPPIVAAMRRRDRKRDLAAARAARLRARRRELAKGGDYPVFVAVSRRGAAYFLKRRGIEVVTDAELLAALGPVLAFMMPVPEK